MSSTAYAYAIVGIRLELANDMFGESRQSSCIHRFDIDTCNFCPQCGKSVTRSVNKFSQFEGRYEFEELLEQQLKTYPNFLIVTLDDNIFIVYGLKISEYDDDHFESIVGANWELNNAFIKEILKTLLEPFGLYNEGRYGFHVVLRC